MANGTKYFIGNWKMFGIPSSFKIIIKLTAFFKRIKKIIKNIKL